MSLTTTKYHLDFLYGIDSHTLVYPQVLKNMRNTVQYMMQCGCVIAFKTLRNCLRDCCVNKYISSSTKGRRICNSFLGEDFCTDFAELSVPF
jgi:hypothetical protein